MGFRVPQKQAPGKRLPAYEGHDQGRVDNAEDLRLITFHTNTEYLPKYPSYAHYAPFICKVSSRDYLQLGIGGGCLVVV